MEFWLSQIPLGLAVVVLIGSFSAIAAKVALFSRQATKGEKTAEQNKVLLKQLLEGFGLEVPAELNEPESAVVKSIKTN